MKRLVSFLASSLVLVTVHARAADVCIDEAAQRALACTGTAKAMDGHRAGPSFHAAKPTSPTTAKPTPREAEVPRDDRSFRLKARDKALLLVEVQRIESLFASTKRTAPDRAQITRRLGDVYVELETAAQRDKTEAEIRRDKLRTTNAAAAGREQTAANDADRTVKAARKRAIELYTTFTSEHPQHAQVDEVLYYLAYEHEQASDMKSARAVYFDLIKKAPQSKYVPNAYLAFGELFFIEAQGDPAKWDLAVQAYQEAAKYPAPANKVVGYAFYKMAFAFWNKGELDRALDAFKKTIEHGVAFPNEPGAARLADNARRDLVPVYALKGDPHRAYPFLHGVAGDPPGANDKTYAMMNDLGTAYLDTGHYPDAITVFRDLIARDRAGDTCSYQAHVTEAVMATKAADKDTIVQELDRQLKVASTFSSSGHDDKQKHACSEKTAALVIETAMAWHLEGVGTPGQRGTNDAKTLNGAARLYERALLAWTKKDLATFTYPRLVKEDWPTAMSLKYALADLLYAQKEWAKCGPAFDAVVAEDPKAPEMAKSAYAAALCYQHAFDASHERRGVRIARDTDESRLKRKEMTKEQIAMLHAFDRYVCGVKPTDAAGREEHAEVAYARARTYFEAHHWSEAAAAFKAIALAEPASELGLYAAQMYLETANVMIRHEGRSCEADMSVDVAKIEKLHCAGDKNAEACRGFKVVAIDLARAEAEKLVKRADASKGLDAVATYERAGSMLYDLFQRACVTPVEAGKKPDAEKCDEIAYNAASAFRAGRLMMKATTARKALVAFDEKTKAHSPLAKLAVYELGAAYQAIAVYDLAAEWYERFTRIDPKADQADRALSDAVLLRLGLGHEADALKDSQDFAKSYGAQKPDKTAQIAFALAAHHAEKEEWEKARGILVGQMPVIDRAAPDVRIQAHATLGRALDHLGQKDRARVEYSQVRTLYRDPAAVASKIKASYANEDEATRQRRLGRTVEAVGEALFFAAEERRLAEVEPLKFPEYRGPGDKASVLAHIDGRVKDWYTKKKAAIEKVEPEYAKILAIEPQPPPKWVIAAGARAGLSWGDFVDDFRRAPIPKAWKGTELEIVYTEAIDRASEPYKARHAKPALEKCLGLSTRFQYFDAHSRSCEQWLAKNYKATYHVVDELRGAATLANGGLTEKGPPVLAPERPDAAPVFWRPEPAPLDKPNRAARM